MSKATNSPNHPRKNSMNKSRQFRTGFLYLALAALCALPSVGQDAPDVGPRPPQPLKAMESHIGHVTGHAKDAKMDYRRYCAGCHGDLGDGNGENAVWLDPKPRDFTAATFKCRSTVTGMLPTDQNLIGRQHACYRGAAFERGSGKVARLGIEPYRVFAVAVSQVAMAPGTIPPVVHLGVLGVTGHVADMAFHRLQRLRRTRADVRRVLADGRKGA